MEFYNYFQAYKDYFWNWEDKTKVLVLPNISTIAYKEQVMAVLECLAPNGVPPFGALLLAFIATNANAHTNLSLVNVGIFNTLDKEKIDTKDLDEATDFLSKLSNLPQEYKEGNNRILLFEMIFKNSHNLFSTKKIERCLFEYKHNYINVDDLAKVKDFSLKTYHKDFRTIALLNKKFTSTEDIINKLAGLAKIEAKDLPLLKNKEEIDENEPFQELLKNEKTFYIASLIKRLWSGLNIPFHNNVPSQQALGGFSDLSNKGELDKLLISEFANDDLVFLSRLANNEALYLNREKPPSSNKTQRIILIDSSLKNWGIPKTIAYALMLAISKHPKNKSECIAFSIGNDFNQIKFDTIDNIIKSLDLLEGALDCTKGLLSFVKNYTKQKDLEVFFISNEESIKTPEIQKILNDNKKLFKYSIHTNIEGVVKIFEGKQNIQHILLPLNELWRKKDLNGNIKAEPIFKAIYPILFEINARNKKYLSLNNGDLFVIDNEKSILRLYDKNMPKKSIGWDLIFENLPSSNGNYELGINEKDEYLLLIFNQQTKKLTLINIYSGETKEFTFIEWKTFNTFFNFIFYEGDFYYLGYYYIYKINFQEIKKIPIENNTTPKYLVDTYYARKKELDAIINLNYNAHDTLKNITSIYINERDNLVFNLYELNLVDNEIKLAINKSFIQVKRSKRVKDNKNIFIFEDGSKIIINRSGMLILFSSNKELPPLYIPSMVNASLGIGTDSFFTGNKFYYKENEINKLEIINSQLFWKKYVYTFINHVKANSHSPIGVEWN